MDPAPTPPLAYGKLSLDPATRTATFGGRGVNLTAIEFAIVKSLLARPAYVLNRAQLVEASHAASIHISARTIDSHIRKHPRQVRGGWLGRNRRTVHGIGFRHGRCGG